MFTATELAEMRAQAEGAMTETATVTRPGGWVDDNAGGGTMGEPTTHTLPCRRYPLGSGSGELERVIAGQLQDASLEVLAFPLGGDLQASDTVTLGGVRYDVERRIPDGTYATQSKAIIRPIVPAEAAP